MHTHWQSSSSMLWKNISLQAMSFTEFDAPQSAGSSPQISRHKRPCQSKWVPRGSKQIKKTIVLFVCFFIHLCSWKTGFIKRLLPHWSSETKSTLCQLFFCFSNNCAFLSHFSAHPIHSHSDAAARKQIDIILIEKDSSWVVYNAVFAQSYTEREQGMRKEINHTSIHPSMHWAERRETPWRGQWSIVGRENSVLINLTSICHPEELLNVKNLT